MISPVQDSGCKPADEDESISGTRSIVANSLDAAERPLLTAVYCSLIWANANEPMMIAKKTLMMMPMSAWPWVTRIPPTC